MSSAFDLLPRISRARAKGTVAVLKKSPNHIVLQYIDS